MRSIPTALAQSFCARIQVKTYPFNSILTRIEPLPPRRILVSFWRKYRFRNYRVRDSLQHEVRNEESWSLINLFRSGTAYYCSDS
jgi:hypothetical protein